MSQIPFTPPTLRAPAYNCSACGAYAQQTWSQAYWNPQTGYIQVTGVMIARCTNCHVYSVWLAERMLHPESSGVPLPNPDLSDVIRSEYDEAASVLSRSPRASAALLRLGIQRLCIELGGEGKNLNDDIGLLVKQGLPVGAQQALDVVRVIGNNAVHAGELDLRDDRATAVALFGLVNLIADVMISQPKRLQEMYNALPTGALEAVERRDRPEPNAAD